LGSGEVICSTCARGIGRVRRLNVVIDITTRKKIGA
jgi:hypothetical protein